MTDDKRVGPPASQVLETEVDGDISIYNPTTEQVTILNETASDVWLLCDGDHTADQIVSLLAASYEIPEADIREQVEETIARLHESGLLSE